MTGERGRGEGHAERPGGGSNLAPRYLLDTVVLIWAVRGLHEAPGVLASLRRRGSLAVSAITVLELRRALSPEEYLAAEEELAGVEVVPLDAAIARTAGNYLVRCADEGYRVDFFAGIIQATAALTGRALVTYSEAHYPLADCEIVPLAALERGGPLDLTLGGPRRWRGLGGGC